MRAQGFLEESLAWLTQSLLSFPIKAVMPCYFPKEEHPWFVYTGVRV